ncbi:MAG: hypothetical protein AAB606_03290 [Patescibacteria group bacterium]
MFEDFFSNTENAQLATLIMLAPLKYEEKMGWLEMLPDMNEAEKAELKENLLAEIDDMAELENQSMQALDERVKAIMPV